MEDNGMKRTNDQTNEQNEKIVGFACTMCLFFLASSVLGSVDTTDENSFRVILAYIFSLLNKFRNIYMQIISQPRHFPNQSCVRTAH